METMTVTNEKTLQQGLNDVVINKVQRMIDGKSVGVQATMERLISEGKIAQDERHKGLGRNNPATANRHTDSEERRCHHICGRTVLNL